MTVHPGLIAVRLIVVLLGAIIVYLALKSYKKNKRRDVSQLLRMTLRERLIRVDSY